MLVLSRNPCRIVGPSADEKSQILIQSPDGTVVTVQLTEVRGVNKARIGVDAPRDWSVVRREIADV